MLAEPLRAPALLALWCLSAGTAQAQAPSLAEALESAYRLAVHQPSLDARKQEAEAIRRQAQGLLAGDPEFVLTHWNDRLNEDAGLQEWEAGIDLPLWLPGQRDARLAVADAAEARAQALSAQQHWENAGKLRESVWNARTAEAGVTHAEQAVQGAKALELTVQKRVQAGELARVDLVQAQQESAKRELELQKARGELGAAMAAYRQLTGLQGLPFDTRETRVQDRDITQHHPALAPLNTQVARARAERDQVRTEGRANPLLTLGARRQRGDRLDGYDHALGLEVRIPFGLETQSAPRLRGAERALSDTERERARLLRELRAEAAGARAILDGADQAMQPARRRQVLAEENLRLTRRAFQLGETDLSQLLRTRDQALDADLQMKLAEQTLGLAVARWNQAMGVLPQ